MSQSLSQIYVHLVFATKEREPWLTEDIEGRVRGFLVEVLNSLGCPAVRVGGMPDHVHALIRLSRTATVADIVRRMKASSGEWLRGLDSKLPGFAWQTGYGAFSLGASELEKAVAYLANQKEHHRTRSFQEEYRLFLRKYGIAFDERYIWD